MDATRLLLPSKTENIILIEALVMMLGWMLVGVLQQYIMTNNRKATLQ